MHHAYHVPHFAPAHHATHPLMHELHCSGVPWQGVVDWGGIPEVPVPGRAEKSIPSKVAPGEVSKRAEVKRAMEEAKARAMEVEAKRKLVELGAKKADRKAVAEELKVQAAKEEKKRQAEKEAKKAEAKKREEQLRATVVLPLGSPLQRKAAEDEMNRAEAARRANSPSRGRGSRQNTPRDPPPASPIPAPVSPIPAAASPGRSPSPTQAEVRLLMELQLEKSELKKLTDQQQKTSDTARELAKQLSLAKKEREELFQEQQNARRERELIAKQLAEQDKWFARGIHHQFDAPPSPCSPKTSLRKLVEADSPPGSSTSEVRLKL